jgi:hypothetical protein
VHDADAVRGGQRGEHSTRDVEGALDAERTVVDLVSQGASRKSLHHEERLAVILTGVVDRHDVGMGETSGRARFSLEAPPGDRLLREVDPQQLHRHHSAETSIGCFAHFGHAAAAELPAQLVAACQHAGIDVAPGRHGVRDARSRRSANLVFERRTGATSVPGTMTRPAITRPPVLALVAAALLLAAAIVVSQEPPRDMNATERRDGPMIVGQAPAIVLATASEVRSDAAWMPLFALGVATVVIGDARFRRDSRALGVSYAVRERLVRAYRRAPPYDAVRSF